MKIEISIIFPDLTVGSCAKEGERRDFKIDVDNDSSESFFRALEEAREFIDRALPNKTVADYILHPADCQVVQGWILAGPHYALSIAETQRFYQWFSEGRGAQWLILSLTSKEEVCEAFIRWHDA